MMVAKLQSPVAIAFCAANFAGLLGMQALVFVEATRESGMVILALIIWLPLLLAVTWWATRELAGRAKGEARPWKWIGYSLLLGIAAGIPIVIAGISMGRWGDDIGPVAVAAVSTIVALALMMPLVRVSAVAISGDRIRFTAIRDTLSTRQFDILPWLAVGSLLSWAGEYIADGAISDARITQFVAASLGSAAKAVGGTMNLVAFVCAYLLVDRSDDEQSITEIFG